MQSTEKIEKIFNEVDSKAKLEQSLPNDILFKQKVQELTKNINKLKRNMIYTSNIFLVVTIFSLFAFYSSLIQKQYLTSLIDIILFIVGLYQFLESYFIIRLYGNEAKVYMMEKKKNE